MLRNYLRQVYRAAIPWLYSRSQYKLFLKTAVGHIDLRMQALASTTDFFSSFVRTIPIQAPFGNSMLVLAPHQDDETIGCGGAMALQARSGKTVSIVVLQDGADGVEELGMSRRELIEMRNEESRRAGAVLGIEPVFLNHQTLADNIPKISAQLQELIRQRKVDAIFTPFLLDGHPDHRTTNYILADALKSISSSVRVFGYEVWGLTIPNVLVVIDDVMAVKLQMLSCFTFANKAIDYVHTTKGLNMFRSRLLGAGECQYAECFFEVPAKEFIDLAERVYLAGQTPVPAKG